VNLTANGKMWCYIKAKKVETILSKLSVLWDKQLAAHHYHVG
jgi:hypothetical protein